MTRFPSLFVSHGSPMLALNPGSVGMRWRELAATMPRPRAVVIVSAHWSAPMSLLGAAPEPETIHDFYGFPAALYQIQYRPPGAPDLARELAEALSDNGWPARCDISRGLDHGAWVPLREMYPHADVPVVPMSYNAQRDPAYHYRLGQALQEVLPSDVMLIASGSLTHNLHDFVRGHDGEAAPSYVSEFQAWFWSKLREGDIDALLDYRRQAPHATRAHPTDDHLLPLYVALGVRAGRSVDRVYDAVSERVLAMDIYRFGEARAANS